MDPRGRLWAFALACLALAAFVLMATFMVAITNRGIDYRDNTAFDSPISDKTEISNITVYIDDPEE